MFVKKFEAPTLEQALSLVKQELGPDALILSTQEKRQNWFNKPSVLITAAFEEGVKRAPKEKDITEDDLANIFPHRRIEFRDEVEEGRNSIRKVKTERYKDIAPKAKEQAPSERYGRGFQELGLSEETAKDLSRRLIFDYSKKDLSVPAFFKDRKVDLLSSGVEVLSPKTFEKDKDWIALGVAGSGKTSLLVKLALFLKRTGHSVSLCSYEDRKIFGAQELENYARLIQVPFAKKPKMDRTIKFYDAPSLELNDENERKRLDDLIVGKAPVLVIDSTRRLAEVLRIAEAAERYGPRAIAFTRLDIASQFGMLFEVLRKTNLPLLGASLSQSFKKPFKFFEVRELAEFIVRNRGIA